MSSLASEFKKASKELDQFVNTQKADLNAFVKESATQLEAMRQQALQAIAHEQQKQFDTLEKLYQDLKDQRSVCSSADDLRDEIQKLRRYIFLTGVLQEIEDFSDMTTLHYTKKGQFRAEREELEYDLDLEPIPSIFDIASIE